MGGVDLLKHTTLLLRCEGVPQAHHEVGGALLKALPNTLLNALLVIGLLDGFDDVEHVILWGDQPVR